MQKVALIVALMLSAGVAHADSYATSDEVCLSVGRQAETVASVMASGVAEGAVMSVYTTPGTAKMTPRDVAVEAAMLKAIPYIYTMRFDPQQTRSIVYMKCKAGEYVGKVQP